MPVSLTDMRFVIHEVLDFEGHYRALGAASEGPRPAAVPDRALIDAVIDEGHRFADAELEPINRSGDAQGCRLADGEVSTPEGFKEAYATYVAGGWAGLIGAPEFGGQGLPHSLSLFLEDLMCCANMAWTMYPGLSRGAISALSTHADAELKGAFLPKLLTGEWTGTMCLTEPQAGSDVGLARTRAEPNADGTWAISGTKIFISAGEHDMAENIVHLVLARVPEAPAGTRGISMFVVPKVRLDGGRNTVTCGAIEHKMGINGSATCVLNFDAATGYLVGEANQGMRYMFTMMNAARLVVGLQGACVAQAALLRSLEYAQERLQMRALSGPVAPDRAADPIIVHADVRRMLLLQRAIAEGGRALVYYAGQVADRSMYGPDDARERAHALLDFLTPIVKGILTELGFESVNQAVQIFGGHGYIRDSGVEQYVRDARITTIYEGTTQIQALDLLGRKVLQTQGKGLMAFLEEVNALVGSLREPLPELAGPLEALAAEWGELSMSLGARAMQNPDEVAAAAVDYLFYSGYAVLAYCWGRTALAAATAQANGRDDDPFLAGKLATARFYFSRVLPRTRAHRAAAEAGAASLLEVSDQALAAV
ncbi:MAG: acyl-CoA dehydrogenase C-terminal domain-containing protein [Pseudomonadales bacterium]